MDFLDLRLLLEIAGLAGFAGAAAAAVWSTLRSQRGRREVEHARRSLDLVPVRVIVADADMNVCRVNDAARRAGAAELLGRGLASLFRDPNALRRILASPGARAHLEPVSIGGQEAVLRLRVLRDHESNACGVVATWTTLAETQDRQCSSMRSTLDRLPLNSLLADAEGCISHVNRLGVQSLHALFPKRSTAWAGRSVADMFGSPVRLSSDDEQLRIAVGDEHLELSTLPLTGSHVVTSGWLVLWRLATDDSERNGAIGSTTEQFTVAAVQLLASADLASDRANQMMDHTREVADNTHPAAGAGDRAAAHGQQQDR
jgi:hypothetical protein